MSGRPAWIAALPLFALLTLATAASWEPAHDEGVTWDQAIAHVDLPGPADPAPFEEVAARLDGAEAPGPREVVARLLGPIGMHPPAYYWGVNALARVGGTGRIWLTLPMIALGLAALLSFRRTAAMLVPAAGAGGTALALLALSPWFIGYLVLARPYGFVLCIAVLSTEGLVRSFSGSRTAFAGFVVLSILGMYSLYHYAFVCGWHLAWLGVHALMSPAQERRADAARIAVALCAWALAYLPWIPSLLHHLEVAADAPWYFVGTVPLAQWPAKLWSVGLVFGLNRALGHDLAFAAVILATVLAVGTLAAFLWSLRSGSAIRSDRVARACFVSALAVPLAVAAIDWLQGTHTLFLSKTNFVFLPIGLLFLTRALAGLGPALLRHAAVALWLGLFLAANVLTLALQLRGGSPVGRVASHVAEFDGADHVVLLSSEAPGYVFPLLLELRRAGVREARVATVDLGAPVESTLRELVSNPEVARVTLVGFAVPWEPNVWDKERLQRLATRAAGAGWSTESMVRRRWSRAGAERVLTIASRLQVAYYAQ